MARPKLDPVDSRSPTGQASAAAVDRAVRPFRLIPVDKRAAIGDFATYGFTLEVLRPPDPIAAGF